MMTIRNVFACLVHERPDCVVDLLRNLRYADPSSLILLYNGGSDRDLLNHGFRPEEYGAVAYPHPRRMRWGRLHDFALDCMGFALEHYPFDTLTIVDSDQLAVRPGYSDYLGSFLAGRSGVGLLGNAPIPQQTGTRIGPAAAAFREAALWRPLLQRFPDGERKFVYWSFWPSTVFTAAAARDLTRFFVRDSQLQSILARSRIWASEEVILPTLVALLGYEIAANPCSYSCVQYRASYTPRHIDIALQERNAFWVHPVPRRADDPLRRHIRAKLNDYQSSSPMEVQMSPVSSEPNPGLLLTFPILRVMREITGWLEDDEADLLIGATARALTRLPAPHAVVEVGSYCGRSTSVLGSVVKALSPQSRVYAIDPHDGKVGAEGSTIVRGTPTRAAFDRNMALAGVANVVVCIQSYSYEVAWEGPISLILIDGLHDYANVSRDFCHFERFLVDNGFAVFHDYANYYPDVQRFVEELLASGRYRMVYLANTLIVLQKISDRLPQSEGKDVASPSISIMSSRTHDARLATPPGPVASCVMPTRDRRAFVPLAIEYFLRQDYPQRELIVVDDGNEDVSDLIPNDPRIRHVRLNGQHSVGEKRNIGCEAARGDVIVHWDDDDWIASRRLSYQIAALLGEGADLCGLSTLLFYAPATNGAWRYIYPQNARPWLSGGTFCYFKDLWRKNQFAHVNIGEDARFVWSGQAGRLLALPDVSFYVAIVHPGNTSPKRTSDVWWRPTAPEEIRALMGDDASFYTALAGARASGLSQAAVR